MPIRNVVGADHPREADLTLDPGGFGSRIVPVHLRARNGAGAGRRDVR